MKKRATPNPEPGEETMNKRQLKACGIILLAAAVLFAIGQLMSGRGDSEAMNAKIRQADRLEKIQERLNSKRDR